VCVAKFGEHGRCSAECLDPSSGNCSGKNVARNLRALDGELALAQKGTHVSVTDGGIGVLVLGGGNVPVKVNIFVSE
jgi:hypothetical protein